MSYEQKSPKGPKKPITAGEHSEPEPPDPRRYRPEARPKVGTFVHGFHITPHWRRSGPDPFRERIDRIFDDAGAWWLRMFAEVVSAEVEAV